MRSKNGKNGRLSRSSCGLRIGCQINIFGSETGKNGAKSKVGLWSKWLNWYRKVHWGGEGRRSEWPWCHVGHRSGSDNMQSKLKNSTDAWLRRVNMYQFKLQSVITKLRPVVFKP